MVEGLLILLSQENLNFYGLNNETNMLRNNSFILKRNPSIDIKKWMFTSRDVLEKEFKEKYTRYYNSALKKIKKEGEKMKANLVILAPCINSNGDLEIITSYYSLQNKQI